MANDDHIRRLDDGWRSWNEWRKANPNGETLNLTGADLSGKDLSEYDLTHVNLRNANLEGANLYHSDLSDSDIAGAHFVKANLKGAKISRAHANCADFTGADLTLARFNYCSAVEINLSETIAIEAQIKQNGMIAANLERANLTKATLDHGQFPQANFRHANLDGASLIATNLGAADFSRASLQNATLKGSVLLGTNFQSADLTGCKVYGISAWDLNLTDAKQSDLVITPDEDMRITVDNIEVAQFIYLLIHNDKLRHIIDTITSKVVLILGRFTQERKAVLDAIREELRKRDYLPVLFDFDKPASRNITETVSLLARMARFVIADITDAKSIPQELMVIVPDLPSVPVQPLLLEGTDEYGMFEHLKNYPWVLPEHRYSSLESLIADLADHVIGPAEAKAHELQAGS